MDKNQDQGARENFPTNRDQQGVDKSPGEQVGQGEQVTNEDLKGKKVDRDQDKDSEQPIRQ